MCDLLKLSLVFLILQPLHTWAQPDFSSYTEFEGVRCYKDAKTTGIMYYAPGKLNMALSPEGKPDFNLLQTRYTGSYLRGDQGTSRFSSLVRFRIVMNRLSPEKYEKIRQKLWTSNQKGELRPLPIYNIATVLGFSVLSGNNGQKDSLSLNGGIVTTENEQGEVKKGLFWKEREFSLRLDDHSSQLLWNGLMNNQTILSFSYAFFSKGVNPTSADIVSDGTSLSRELVKKLKEMKDSAKTELFCVNADAFSFQIDQVKWPDLMQKIDVNEDIPPGYPALEVRCYDFCDNLRPDLYAKNVEFKAQAPGRGEILTRVRFDRKNPDLSVYHVRFSFAVQIGKPLLYRITEVSDEDTPYKSEWIPVESWNALIDVTSPKDKIKVSKNIEE
jgi:hypothetical protein